MKLRTMRAVDYWIGIPFCFLCTFLTRLSGKPRGPEQPRRILFIELSEMGSTVIANPALQKAKDRLNAEIFFLIFERNVDSLRLLNTVPMAVPPAEWPNARIFCQPIALRNASRSSAVRSQS